MRRALQPIPGRHVWYQIWNLTRFDTAHFTSMTSAPFKVGGNLASLVCGGFAANGCPLSLRIGGTRNAARWAS
jgi:hypothetical protein